MDFCGALRPSARALPLTRQENFCKSFLGTFKTLLNGCIYPPPVGLHRLTIKTAISPTDASIVGEIAFLIAQPYGLVRWDVGFGTKIVGTGVPDCPLRATVANTKSCVILSKCVFRLFIILQDFVGKHGRIDQIGRIYI